MNSQSVYLLAAILGTAIVTFGLRATPFLFFRKKKAPSLIVNLGKVLPAALIAELVVYCFKDLVGMDIRHIGMQVVAGCTVVFLHIWKKNILLSIAGGTVLYMGMLQLLG